MEFDIRIMQARENDPNAPVAPIDIRTPSANVPEACADTLDYSDLAFMIHIAQQQLSHELYLKQLLSEACGSSAIELGEIAENLEDQVKLDA